MMHCQVLSTCRIDADEEKCPCQQYCSKPQYDCKPLLTTARILRVKADLMQPAVFFSAKAFQTQPPTKPQSVPPESGMKSFHLQTNHDILQPARHSFLRQHFQRRPPSGCGYRNPTPVHTDTPLNTDFPEPTAAKFARRPNYKDSCFPRPVQISLPKQADCTKIQIQKNPLQRAFIIFYPQRQAAVRDVQIARVIQVAAVKQVQCAAAFRGLIACCCRALSATSSPLSAAAASFATS